MRVIMPPASTGTPPYARARLYAAQNVPSGAWTQVAFTSDGNNDTNTAGGAMSAGGVFTAPSAGVYDVSVSLLWGGLAAGDYLNVAVRKNSGEALKIAETSVPMASGAELCTAAGPLRLSAGDTLSVWAYCVPGRALIAGPFAAVTIVRMGG